MYDGVPSATPAWVSSGPRSGVGVSLAGSASPRRLASPQSTTTVSPYGPTITLEGLRSRCTTARAWA